MATPKTINFTFDTSQLPGTYYWTNDGPDSTTEGADFVDGQNSGSFTVTGSFSASVSPPVYNTGTFSRDIKGDFKTEGPEYIHMRVRRDSITGKVLVMMNKVLVNDTSTATTAPPTSSAPSPATGCITEGSTLGGLLGPITSGVASITGSTTGGTVWGDNVYGYTTDSDFAKAAVHAGILTAGQTGNVRFTNLGSRPGPFPGTTANGVTTSPWSTSWCTVTLSAA